MQRGDFGGGKWRRLLDGALNFVPLWACIGIAAFVLIQENLMGGLAGALLLATAALGLFELRRYWKSPPAPPVTFTPRPVPALMAQRRPRFQVKQTLMLLALVGAYLHYYFWDVQMQIAMLPSVTVFVAAPLHG